MKGRMQFYSRFISNHPLANITFMVVLLLGLMAYLGLPREQDPEINFNWVQITVALPGASPEDVEKRVLQPLEDAIQNVSDIRFISSAARDGLAGILVRFDEVPVSTFDKRVERPAARDPEQGARRTAGRGEGSADHRNHQFERLSDRADPAHRPCRRRGTARAWP